MVEWDYCLKPTHYNSHYQNNAANHRKIVFRLRATNTTVYVHVIPCLTSIQYMTAIQILILLRSFLKRQRNLLMTKFLNSTSHRQTLTGNKFPYNCLLVIKSVSQYRPHLMTSQGYASWSKLLNCIEGCCSQS